MPATIGIPAKPLAFPRNIITLLRNNLELVPQKAYEEFVVIAPGPPKMAFVTGPEHVKTILQDSWDRFPRGALKTKVLKPLFGDSLGQVDRENWKWQRQAVAPLFRHGELLKLGPTIQKAAGETLEKWKREASSNPVRLLNKDMLHLAYRIVSQTLLTGFPDEFLDEIEAGHKRYFESMNWWIAYAMFSIPSWAPRPGGRQMRNYERRIRESVLQLVKSRREKSGEADDLIHRWMVSPDPETGRYLSDELLRDNVISLLVSGYETVALSLVWAIYLISTHPQWEEAILSEVEAVAGGEPVSAKHVAQLQTVEQVVNETLRLYPASPFIVRDVQKTVLFDDVEVQAGTVLFVPIYTLHRHSKLWEDPDEFKPERFAGDYRNRYSKYQFIPFGAGPRVCIGASYAMMELTMLVATLVRAVRFEQISDTPPQPVGRSVLVPREDIALKISFR